MFERTPSVFPQIPFSDESVIDTVFKNLFFSSRHKKVENKNVVSAPLHLRDRLLKEAPFVDGEIRRFEISIEEFDECVKEISSRLKKTYIFLYFCSSLHQKIDQKIKHGDYKICSKFLSYLLNPDKEYVDVKKVSPKVLVRVFTFTQPK